MAGRVSPPPGLSCFQSLRSRPQSRGRAAQRRGPTLSSRCDVHSGGGIGGGSMRYEDIPRDFNITAHFLDGRLQTPGGGARTALITGDGPVSYAELAAKANRVGNVLAARSSLLSYEWVGRGVLDIRPDDVVLPVPKLFFGYARDFAALYPIGAGAAGIVFPERSTADRIFELIARHRPTVLVNVPTM